jgi:hypothetical protein
VIPPKRRSRPVKTPPPPPEEPVDPQADIVRPQHRRRVPPPALGDALAALENADGQA